ncbi:DUF2271 domain-containing protein [Phenylobacterium immobile]|uniref:DUF2271 domain-containing protein n=1 Tax=Phenylobacterium immobile TaxID=21 RepID=UPI000A8A37E9|nr:DUF2271 domain-containing protein [Phenylobacterium immobile]
MGANHHIVVAAAGLAGLPVAGQAAELNVSLELPKMTVAEYHRPYVAVWIEGADQAAVKTLAVWYDVKKRDNEGVTWLKDMRQWWRKAGRTTTMPIAGVSGPTKAPGKQQLVFTRQQMTGVAPGAYNLVVEAAREVGGREVLRAPFVWGAKGAAKTSTVQGTSELGAISVTAEP